MPCRRPSYLAAALSYLAFGVATLAAAEPSAWLCGNTGTFAAGSIYQQNLHNLTSHLPSLVASAPTLFASATVGDVPDSVNGAAFCRRDAEASECRACVATAFLDAQQTCVYLKDVAVFQDLCVLRFSNEEFLGAPVNDGIDKFRASTGDRRVLDHTRDLGAAVAVLLNKTLQHAAASSSRFGTATQGFANLDASIARMYSMAQCVPSMSTQDCLTCLSQLLRRMSDFYRGERDGRLLLWRCFLRFDDHKFFGGKPSINLPPAPAGETTQDYHARASIEISEFLGGGERRGKHKRILLAIIIPTTVVTVVILVVGFLVIKTRRKTARQVELQQQGPLHSQNILNTLWQTDNSSGLTLFNFSDLAAATGHFSDENRLGRGGFGAVYKGKLEGGAEIAVKRLSLHSSQGLEQFKNEVELIVKLQHTNLVRLVGCCVHEAEKLVVYEYMPNGSLNSFIFDLQRGASLNWEKRLNIIEGIAQGLRYLHEHSRVRIIHRDLKASNILLDRNMNPKISDFGLARILPSNVSEANTNRVAGSYGYMAPKYFLEGTFSVKSDVFSFGVLLLEVISGKRNNGNDQYGGFSDLLEYAWQLWREGKIFELIDPMLGVCGQVMVSIERCVKVALLCVQDSATDRPTIADVTAMLVGRDGTTSLPDPRRPQQLSSRGITTRVLEIRCGSHGTRSCTTNAVSITSIQGR
ncbi:unnamed protein product [Urochloa decumbens]|uniref:non-specific serine/threonine protein kinase n=1 Tax=Urochloa decumbens TaxID=240449 RepID=A0ABC8XNQ7_9POAL